MSYQRGKIYKIVCNTTGLTYYGSTTEPTLARRLATHNGDYKLWKKGLRKGMTTSFKILENNNYEIVLVELYPCDSKDELHKRERFYIENNECVNKYIPARTPHEYKEYFKEYFKEYNEEHREEIKKKSKKHYEEHKEEINERRKAYREEHKEETKEYYQNYRATHKQEIKEKFKKHYEEHKEEINAKRREYYKAKKENKIVEP